MGSLSARVGEVCKKKSERERCKTLIATTVVAADDFNPRMVHAALVRATIARGRITSIDTSKAAAVKGVLLALTPEIIGEIVSPSYVFEGGTA